MKKNPVYMNRSGLELALRFVAWAQSCRYYGEPSVAAIRDRWHVSRATAYRWRAAWLDARHAFARWPHAR